MGALGKHILVEFIGCEAAIMNDVAIIEKGMEDAAEVAGATIINSTFHHFSPYGVSGVVVIQESHLAIHTWPEYQYAAVDLFTCGDTVDAWKSFDHLKEVFKATNYSALEMFRGNLNLLNRIDFDLSSIRSEAGKRVQGSRNNRNVWFTDKDDNQALSLRYTGELLYNKTSEFQQVRVIDTYAYGKTLTIDNMVMTTEKDEFHYHEMIAHPAMLCHAGVKNVLVIGGGDGGTVREVLRYSDVEQVTMVEIDANVVEASKEHLPNIAASFDDPRLNLIIGDGIEFLNQAEDATYDLILVDGSDPVGPAEGLFSPEFYRNAHRALKSDGLLVAQGESPVFNREVFVDIFQCIGSIFGNDRTHTLLFQVPTYPSGTWSFMIAGKNDWNPKNPNTERYEAIAAQHDFGYYNLDVHQAAFAQPNYIKKMLHGSLV
ncbi:polyamine aminopropyltransferase [bacterium SCSIO 12741]|nr:polyamine aminopropyltransferase [bacterium SCSIO 12741]